MIPASPFLCVITDEAFCPVTLAEQALKGGASMIQLRHKTASGNQLYNWAVEIRGRCSGNVHIGNRIDAWDTSSIDRQSNCTACQSITDSDNPICIESIHKVE